MSAAAMPSLPHEALVELFRNRPALAPELIRDVLHQRLPAYDDIEIKDANLSQLVPTEYRADLVVLLREGEPVFGIVVEVQLDYDGRKRYSWPLYGAALRARHRCPACVMVVTADPAIAHWAARPIDLGQPGSSFTPLVLGPGAVPWIADAEVARAAPELAVLSVMAHGHRARSIDVATAALAAASGLDDERAKLYCDLVHLALSDAARAALEELMESGKYEYQSNYAKKYIAKGLAQGRAEGRAEGEAKGRAEVLLKLLTLQGVELSDQQRHQVLSCADPVTLDEWIERVFRGESIVAVLQEG